MLQLALTVSIYLLIVIPAGVYLYHIAAGKHTFADPVFDRVDGAIYKISGVDPGKGMNWKQYALALLGTNAVMVLHRVSDPAHPEHCAFQPQRHREHGADAGV